MTVTDRFCNHESELTYTLPAYQTPIVVDIMAHVMERYFPPKGM